MAKHKISFTIPEKFALAKDIEFEIVSDGKKLGTLLISKGNIEWVPVNNKINKHRIAWEKFGAVMAENGREVKISKRQAASE